MSSETCSDCYGSGVIERELCPLCKGRSRPAPTRRSTVSMTETNISHIIGQRVIARSPQTGRRYCGEVIGIASLPRLNEPVVIIRLDHGGSLMRVFPYCIKLDEEGSEWLR